MACSNDIPTKDVPSVILNTFKSQFPKALDIEWEKENNIYEVEFELENTDHTARYNTDGKLIIFKKDIHTSELPQAIKSVLSANFKDYVVDETELVKKGNATYYQLELESRGKRDKKLVFSEDGKENRSIKYWK